MSSVEHYNMICSNPRWDEHKIPTGVFYVYAYVDDIREEVIYIGKGSKQRAVNHLAPCNRLTGKYSKNPFYRRINKMISADNNPSVYILYVAAEEGRALSSEVGYIKLLGRRQLGTGTLWNMTSGGEGVSGSVWSEERRINAAAVWTEEKRQAHSEMMIRTWSDPVHKDKVSASHSEFWEGVQGVTCPHCGAETKHRRHKAVHFESCAYKPESTSNTWSGYLGKLWYGCESIEEFKIRRQFYGYTCNPNRGMDTCLGDTDIGSGDLFTEWLKNPMCHVHCTWHTLNNIDFNIAKEYTDKGLESFDIYD